MWKSSLETNFSFFVATNYFGVSIIWSELKKSANSHNSCKISRITFHAAESVLSLYNNKAFNVNLLVALQSIPRMYIYLHGDHSIHLNDIFLFLPKWRSVMISSTTNASFSFIPRTWATFQASWKAVHALNTPALKTSPSGNLTATSN